MPYRRFTKSPTVMLVFEPTKVGERIARGADRSVYAYEGGKVVKISRLTFLFGPQLRDKFVRDYAICKQYLPRFVVDTVDVTPADTRSYIVLQDRIDGEMLRKYHLRDPHVRSQFTELLTDMQRMVTDGYPPIDLMGNLGVIRPVLSNVMVDRQRNLRIVDAALLETRSVDWSGWIFEPIVPIAKMRQRYLIRSFLR